MKFDDAKSPSEKLAVLQRPTMSTKPRVMPPEKPIHRLHIVLPRSLAAQAFQRADAENYPSISEYVRQLVRDDLKTAKTETK